MTPAGEKEARAAFGSPSARITMATVLNPPPAAKPPAPVVGQGRVSRWLAPSFFDLILIAIPAWLFFSGGAGFNRLLLDGDTGWHIRLGQWILEHGRVPRTDIFSFSKFGEPWFAWEWLADVVYALLMGQWGLQGVVWWSALLFVVSAGILFRFMVWRGANLFVAAPLTLLSVSVVMTHLLARPHLYTFIFFPVLLWLVHRDLRKPAVWIWSLIPLTVFWTNLHGGWAGGVASLGVITVALALEAGLRERSWFAVRRYALLTAGCFVASFVNPYGWRLHQHITTYLGDPWIKEAVQEFKSPEFRGEHMFHFEILLIAGLIGCAFLLRQRRLVEPFLVLFWAHLSLTSVRHASLFVIVAAPMLAALLMELWRSHFHGARRTSIRGILDGLAADCQPALRRTSVWTGLLLAGVMLPFVPVNWPKDFPAERYPVALVREYAGLFTAKRTLTNDEWADYLLYANYPGQRVFFDGRSDFYGKSLGQDFLSLLRGSYQWRELLDRYRIELVLLGPGHGLSSLLKEDPEWILLRDTGRELLFERREVAGKRTLEALMELPRSAE